jgi:hypothetical protein
MKRGHIFALCFLLSASFGYCSENRYSEIAKKVADEMSQPEKTYTITERELESLIKGKRDLSEILNIGSQIKQREQDKIEKERKEKVDNEKREIEYQLMDLRNKIRLLEIKIINLETQVTLTDKEKEYFNRQEKLQKARDKEREGIK